MKKEIADKLKNAVTDLQKKGVWPVFDVPEIKIDCPKEEKLGDYSANIAMVLAKKIKKTPLETANQIISSFQFPIHSSFKKIEAVNPGYINFYLSEKYLRGVIAEINERKEKFGDFETGKGKKINNEFISANPTGPLTVGNGRGGFCGDVIGRVCRKAGFEVVNEFYVNDAGGQIEKLGHSVLKNEKAAYSGEYIDELNEKYSAFGGAREVGEAATKDVLENIIKKTVAEKMRISYDVWMSEKEIHEKYVEKSIQLLKYKKLTYEADGALWLKTTKFGDDKDRVLIKCDGQKAYFAGDCGYMLNKIERKFDRMIMILGADHHGYVTRLKALSEALGFAGRFDIIITQMVRVTKDGKDVRMSKRAGNAVYISELIDKVGHDAARFFFLMYSPDAHMNFNLNLAEEKSEKNPVYYVQYAHARICSILRKARNENRESKTADYGLLAHPKELVLMKELNKFPDLAEEITENCEVHKLPHFAMRLADKFHSFYDACRVIDEKNPELSGARQGLANAVKIVLAETLRLIGVSAPEKM